MAVFEQEFPKNTGSMQDLAPGWSLPTPGGADYSHDFPSSRMGFGMMEWGRLPPHHVSRTKSGLPLPPRVPRRDRRSQPSHADTHTAGAFCQLRVLPSLPAPAFPFSAAFWVNALAYDPSLEQVPGAVSVVPRVPEKQCCMAPALAGKDASAVGVVSKPCLFCGVLYIEGSVFSRSQHCFVFFFEDQSNF